MKLDPILLVEDDPKDIELTIAALKGSNLSNEVIALRDGQEALDFLYREGAYQSQDVPAPAMIFLDIKLPKVNGFEVLKQVRSDPRFSHTPVVMLTNSAVETDLVSSEALGANAFVVKPIGFMDLFDTIKGLSLSWAMLKPQPSIR
jgi:CheY-like chemotaxis protein